MPVRVLCSVLLTSLDSGTATFLKAKNSPGNRKKNQLGSLLLSRVYELLTLRGGRRYVSHLQCACAPEWATEPDRGGEAAAASGQSTDFRTVCRHRDALFFSESPIQTRHEGCWNYGWGEEPRLPAGGSVASSVLPSRWSKESSTKVFTRTKRTWHIFNYSAKHILNVHNFHLFDMKENRFNRIDWTTGL